MTPEEYRTLATKPKRSKFGAKPTIVDGIRFHSTGEAKRWMELLTLQAAGEVRDVRRQVAFAMRVQNGPVIIRSAGYPEGRVAKYTADFTYFERDSKDREQWVYVIEDFKGHDASESRLRRAVIEAMLGTRIRITGGRHARS